MPVDLITVGGLERRRETGFGLIKAVDVKGRNAQVQIDAERLTDPVTGWADTTDGGWSTILTARDEARRVRYVVDVHHRNDADRAKPLAALGNREKVRDLVELAIVDGEGRIIGSPYGRAPQPEGSPAAAAPVSTPPPPAAPPAPPAAPEAPAGDVEAPPPPPAPEEAPDGSTGPPACARCGVELRNVRVLVTPEGRVHRDGCPAGADQHGTGTAAARPPRLEEARPWQLHNTDGSLNLGSFAMTAAACMADAAFEVIAARAAATGNPISFPSVDRLAETLLKVADRVQSAVRPDGRHDRLDNSHTRARGAVLTALKAHPVPFDAAGDTAEERARALEQARATWLSRLEGDARDLLRLAVRLTEADGT